MYHASSETDLPEPRCDSLRFNCGNRNPCTLPRCDAAAMKYPGIWRNKYVECAADGGCQEQDCDQGMVFNDDDQTCIQKHECI